MVKSREVHLKSRPTGAITPNDFELVTVDVPAPRENEVLVKNLWMSIDAGQRTLMGTGERDLGDLPPKRFALNEPMEGQAVGQVIESRSPIVPVGTYVVSNCGWREYFTHAATPNRFTFNLITKPVAPLQTYLHLLSIYGASAYFHVTEGAQVKAGETVWISTAAGATGSIACQIAKMSGCRVVGTTGSDEKVKWLLRELKIDAAANYRKENLRAALQAACPDGIDVYLDYAGGEQLELAIDLMNPHGRIVKVGETSTYDGGAARGPNNMFALVLKRVQIRGFSVFDFLEPASWMTVFEKRMSRWIAEGKIKMHETIYEGIENAVQAQIDLFRGKNIGKMLVKLGEEEMA
jgi:NADPH-dependent curcumin reductase CurA